MRSPFSPDSKLLVSAGEDDQLVLWDVQTAAREKTATLRDDEYPAFHVAFSTDSAWIATGSAHGAVTVWNAEKLERTCEPALEHDKGIFGLEFSPDSKTLASASADQSVRLWDVAAMKAGKTEPSTSLVGYSEGVYSIAFSPYSDLLATGHTDGTVTLWNLSDKPRLADKIEAVSGEVNALAFGPGGKVLVSAQSKAIVVWDAEKRKWQTDALQSHRWPVTSVAAGPRSSLIASASQDMTIRLWDSASGRQLGPSLKGHAGGVNAVAFSPHGDLLASASDDKTIRLWQLGAQRSDGIDASLIAELIGHTKAVMSVVFSSDGNTLASGGWDNTVRLWDLQSGKQVGQPLAKHAAAVFRVAFHPDGKRLASGDRDGSLILWDCATGQPRRTNFAGHNGATVIGLAFHPNGRTLLSAGFRSAVVQWDLDTGQAIELALTDLGSSVTSLAVDPTGNVLAAGTVDAINVLDLTGAKPAGHLLENALQGIRALAISHNGATLAAGGDTGNVICWDTRTNREKGIPLRSDEASITRLLFSPDDRLLGAVSKNRIVFWNLEDEGKTMFSADDNGVIFGWDLNVDSWQSLAASIAGRGFTSDEAMEYLREESPPPMSDAATLLKCAHAAALKKASGARALFAEAVRTAITSKDPGVNNEICWQGSLYRFADVVLPAGDRAVEVADEEKKAHYRDTRGLARGLAGRKKEAIEDFRAFIDWAENHKLYDDRISKRKEWIKKMEDNQDPFTDETLRELRGEVFVAD
jgi:WD40 repeat protein